MAIVFLIYLAAMSAAAFCLYASDKKRAKKERQEPGA